MDEAERQRKMAQRKLEKTRSLDEVAVLSTYSVYQEQVSRLHEIEKEIDNCLIRAPRDGMVVYYVEERARFGSSQGVIAQGELVKEGQKLLAVPDLAKMVVNARIHEAMISRVIDDKETATGFSEVVNTALLFSPHPLGALSAYVSFDMDMQAAFSNANAHLEKTAPASGHGCDCSRQRFPRSRSESARQGGGARGVADRLLQLRRQGVSDLHRGR